MQIEYKGEHSLTFYDYRNATMDGGMISDMPVYNTWSTWHLIPTTPPYITPYSPKINQVEIPGSNGVIDLSESLNGSVLYERRTGDWEFILDSEKAGKNPWEMYHDIREDIHGKWVVVASPDLPLSEENKYRLYTGRVMVSDFTVGNQYATIKLSYNLGARNAAWISTGKRVGAQDVAWFIRENIDDNWTPETFNDADNGMIEDSSEHVISEDQFQIEWMTPDGPMYEIEVDDDGTLIAEVPVPDIQYEEEIVFDDEGEWDSETSPFVTYTVRYLNDDGSILLGPESIIFGTVINPSIDYQEVPVSQIETAARFTGWSEDDGVVVNSNIDIYAIYDYDVLYYKVRFYNDDNSYITETIVIAGGTAVYPIQTMPISAVYGSSFSIFREWSKKLESVFSDMDVTAVYETVVRVRFYNDDGKPIIVDQKYVDVIVPYGTSVAYPYDENPTSSYDDIYVNFQSEFIGWDKSLSNLMPTKDELDSDGFYRVQAQYEYGNRFKVNLMFVRDYVDYMQDIVVDTKYLQPEGMLDLPAISAYSSAANSGYNFLGWNENRYSSSPMIFPFKVTRDMNLFPIFEYNSVEESWESIFESEMDGSYRTKYHIGDHMPLMSVSGYITWVMEIASIDADLLSDSSGNAKITWISNSIWQPVTMNPSRSNDGGWANSELRRWLNEDVLNLYFPEYLAEKICEVKKTFYNKTTNSTLTSNDKIWIPSARELSFCPNIGSYNENSGVIYEYSYRHRGVSFSLEPYYPNRAWKNYTSDGKRKNVLMSKYWLRSACPNTNYSFSLVDESGHIQGTVIGGGTGAVSNMPYGLVFGFCT